MGGGGSGGGGGGGKHGSAGPTLKASPFDYGPDDALWTERLLSGRQRKALLRKRDAARAKKLAAMGQGPGVSEEAAAAAAAAASAATAVPAAAVPVEASVAPLVPVAEEGSGSDGDGDGGSSVRDLDGESGFGDGSEFEGLSEDEGNYGLVADLAPEAGSGAQGALAVASGYARGTLSGERRGGWGAHRQVLLQTTRACGIFVPSLIWINCASSLFFGQVRVDGVGPRGARGRRDARR